MSQTFTASEEFEDLFDGTLGTWNITTVELELKDNVKPMCSRTYTVPKLHETIFKKEFEGLVRFGLLEESNDSKWGAPSFS